MFDKSEKDKIANAATAVYQGYLGLDFFANYEFTANDGRKFSLLAEIKKYLPISTETTIPLTINGKAIHITLTPNPATGFNISFQPRSDLNSARKTLKDYLKSPDLALELLLSQDFSVEVAGEDQKLFVANQLKDGFKIGGKNKTDLYRTHLVTLNNIIEKISSADDISALLVAMATGSGKTWVQAIWMQVLFLAGKNGVFAIPNKLVTQYLNDLKDFLPDEVYASVLHFREEGEGIADLEAGLDKLQHPDNQPQIIVGSSELLLDKYYQKLFQAAPSNTFLSFDEQHLLMKRERRRLALIELSKKFLTMFLTATPNQETYELAGNKPVAIMSSGQKEASGQGQFPILHTLTAENTSDKNKFNTWRFWTADFWETVGYNFLSVFFNAIQPEQSSAAVSLVANLPFDIDHKQGETDPRWAMQVPMARKMLCIIDDNEDLVNFCRAITQQEHSSIYRNGNVIDRSDIGGFFSMPNLDVLVTSKDKIRRRDTYHKDLNAEEINIGYQVANKSLAEQLKYNIFHNMIEYILSDITGMKKIEHNKWRKRDIDGFVLHVREKFKQRDANYFQNKLQTKIDQAGAEQIAKILALISRQISNAKSNMDFKNIVDNWELDYYIVDRLMGLDDDLRHQFDDYAQSHLILGVMQGMSKSETPVKASTPFWGLHKEIYSMYDDGVLKDDLKKRQHTTLEMLDDQSHEYKFTPKEAGFSEDIADAYFRLGMVGVYVSDNKTEGFSDSNLHTVLNVSARTESTTNNPATLIQGIGRNRGLDDTVVPAYIHALGRGERSIFRLTNLKLDDYYPALFKAQKSYNKQFIRVLGENVCEEVLQWYRENIDEDETVDPDKLKKQVLRSIAKALRHLNDNNGHKLKLSRSQLTKVISVAMRSLDKEIARLNKPFKISLLVRIFGSILNFICEVYYTIRRITPSLQMLKFRLFAKPSAADSVYLKILRKTSYKKIIENANVGRELNKWLHRKFNITFAKVQKNMDGYLKDADQATFAKLKANSIGPTLAKFVLKAKQQQVINALQAMPNLLHFMQKNKDIIEEINERIFKQEKVLELLQTIPGLEDLCESDIVNYPQLIAGYMQGFQAGFAAMLTNNHELRTNTFSDLAAYLQDKFIIDVRGFLLDRDRELLKDTLSDKQKGIDFLNHLLAKYNAAEDNDFSQLNLIAEANEFFKFSPAISLIDLKLNECRSTLEAQLAELQVNIFANLSADKLATIVDHIRLNLIPCLVNIYPLNARARIVDAATSEKIANYLKSLSPEELEFLKSSGDKVAIATTLFNGLEVESLPDPLDLSRHQEQIQNDLRELGADVINHSFRSFASKVMNPSSLSGMGSQKKEYIYDAAIVSKVIKSTSFAEGVSLLISYSDWQDLQAKIATDKNGSLILARIMIDNQEDHDFMANPDRLIQAINDSFGTQYQFVGQKAQKAQTFLEQQSQSIKEDLASNLSAEYLANLAAIIRNQFIPILAMQIIDDDKRSEFLKLERSDEELARFIFVNYNKLANLESGSKEQVEAMCLDMLNQLLPADSSLSLEEIDFQLLSLKEKGKLIKEEIKLSCIKSYFNSTHFRSFLEQIFNGEDYSLIVKFLENSDNINALAIAMQNSGLSDLTVDNLLAILRAQTGLKDIKTLDERMQEAEIFLSKLSFNILDASKLLALSKDELSEVLFHPEMSKTISNLVGFLSTDDLQVILESLGEEKIEDSAKLITKFITMLQRQDKQSLAKDFLNIEDLQSMSAEDIASRTHENLHLIRAMKLLTKVIEEVLNCHCHYNQQDRKGVWTHGDVEDSKLVAKLSHELKSATIDYNDSYMNFFSRRIFFIQSLRNGVPRCAKVNAAANQQEVKTLERVKKHILRPMWWSVNLSTISFRIVKFINDVGAFFKACAYMLLNFLKAVINLFKSDKIKLAKFNKASDDFNTTAFAMADYVNKMAPLHVDKLDSAACPIDTVSGFEVEINERKPMRFFEPPVGYKFCDVPVDELQSEVSPQS